MQYYLASWSLLLGLVIGSFLNVVIYRLPRHESLMRPGSHCPKCGTAIRWYDNIPVGSWLLLRGRCRSCHAPIAIRYPLVESITGIGFLVAFVRVGVSPAVFLAWALIAVVVTLTWIEHDVAVIPNRLMFPAVMCGLAAAIALDPHHWWWYPAAGLGTGLMALVLSFLRPGLTSFSAAKMALLLGAVFGPWALVALAIATIILILARISLVFCQKGRLKARTVSCRI